MSDASTLLLAFIGSGAATGLVSLLGDKIKRKWKKEDAGEDYAARIDKIEKKLDVLADNQEKMKKSQKVTTRERIRYLGLCYIGAKKITLDDRETLEEMHEAYEELGGNGALDTVMAEVDKLPVVDSWTSKSTAKAE